MLDWTLLDLPLLSAAVLVLAGLALIGVCITAGRFQGWQSVLGVQDSSWQRSPLLLIVPLLVLGVVAAFTMRPPLPESTVPLPIEVIGQDGHTESVTVQVSSGGSVDQLYLQVHNLAYHWSEYAENGTDPYSGQADQERYDEKASFRVNGGAWIGITNERVTCLQPERHYDCMMGPIGNKTLRLRVEATESGAWVDGENTIEFRFNGTEGISSGYRILRLDVQSGGTSLLTNTTFNWDNPANWTAPLTNQSDIDEGERLWNERNILTESPRSDRQLVSSCADCHTKEAHDLKYFNFSNKSIVTRSEFHGLTEKQGRQIASYVRTRDPQLPSGYTVADAGRPWNPPYQPGPTLDDRPVELWAAGAGIDCVLEDDNDAAQLAIPDASSESLIENADYDSNFGVDCNKLADQTDWSRNSGKWWEAARPKHNLNQREWPVAVQYPDIFEWWPDVHPYDIFGVNEVQSDDWYQHIETLHQNLSTDRAGYIAEARNGVPNQEGLAEDFKKADRLQHTLDESKLANQQFRAYFYRQGLQQFNSMLLWDIVQTYDIEDIGNEVYGDSPNGIDVVGSGDRAWLNVTTIYDLSPHKSFRNMPDGVGGYPNEGMWRRPKDRFYWGDVWYDVGILLTPGHRVWTNTRPIDWNYNYGHIMRNQSMFGGDRWSGRSQMTRYFKHYFKVVQESTRPEIFPSVSQGGDASDQREAWPVALRNHGWAKIEYDQPAFSFRGIKGGTGSDQELYHMLRQTAMKAWFHNSLKYPRSDWATEENGYGIDKFNRVEPSTYDPSLYEGYPYYRILEKMQPTDSRRWSDALVGVLTRYTQDSDMVGKTRATLIDSMATWGERMWPGYDWEKWMIDGSLNQKPSVSLTSPSDGASFSAPADLSLTADASDSDGSISKVIFYAGDTQIAEVTSSPYEATWSGVGAGSYTLTAEATDDGGATTTSAAVDVTVQSASGGQNGVLYSYYEDDWSQLPDFSTLTALTSDTTSIFDTSVRERADQFGLRFTSYIEIPSSATGTYTFYTSSDDGSRLSIDGQEIVNNDGLHGVEEQSGDVSLSSGWHKVVVEYFEQNGGEELTVSWDGPSFSKQEIPSVRLFVAPEQSQSISLHQGWNLISSRLTPTPDSLRLLFTEVESDLAIVQNQGEEAYDPTQTSNTLETWDSSQGYRVYMTRDRTLTIDGFASQSLSLDLKTGWNLIPYYPERTMSPDEAFSAISDKVEIVKDEFGNSYIPARNLDEIETLTPGRAYKIYVNGATTFRYP